VRARVFGVVVFALVLVLAPPHGFAQSPPQPAPLPSPGFVSPYEIMRTARAAGFDPVSPPLREGTTYVLRAYDFRGILMRVVVDARSGAIRDANRIVRDLYDPDAEDEIGMVPPYGAPPGYVPSSYGTPPAYGAALDASPSVPPPVAHSAARATGLTAPPLPRPRPAELASRKPAADAGSEEKAKPGAESVAPAAASKAPAISPALND
jgi:hypothetical protein